MDLKDFISKILTSIEKDTKKKLLKKLEELGDGTLEDFEYIEPEDLMPILKAAHARKLVKQARLHLDNGKTGMKLAFALLRKLNGRGRVIYETNQTQVLGP